MLFKISSCLLLLLFMIVRGDYILSVQVHSYDNPSSRCAGCRFQGCCDLPLIDNCGSLCDNEFFYCLRPLGTPNQSLQVIEDTVDERSVETRAAALQCMESPAAVRTSQVDLDAARNIVFTGTEYLGINNPIIFVVTMEKWEGIQLYADAIDRDVPGDGDELIESFSIDLEPERLAPGLNLESVNVSGRFGFASTVLSFQHECQPGFIGESCVEISQICTTDPCSNNGTCIQSDTGFTCVCMGDFTGDTCETRIDNCEGVDCNFGTCVDGVEMFTCQCDSGYSGDLCDVPTTTSSSSSSRSSVLAGAVGGSVAFIIIIIIIIIVIIIIVTLSRHKVEATSSIGEVEYEIPTEGDQIKMERNVVYGVPTGGDQIEMKRNVVYGVSTGGDQIEMERNVVYGVSTGGDIEMERNVVYGVSTGGDQIEMKRNVVYGVSTGGDQIEMENVVYGV